MKKSALAIVSFAVALTAGAQNAIPTPEQFFVFRCGRCGQKVRYLAAKAGRPGKCPRCKTACTLPVNPQLLDEVAYNAAGYPVKVGQVLR